MKSISSKSKSKLIITLSLIVILLLAGGAFAYWKFAQQKDNKAIDQTQSETESSTNYKPPTNDEKTAGSSQKQETVNNDKNGNSTPASNLSVTITAANQNGNTLNIRTLIATISSAGSCTLTLTKNSQTVTKTSGIQALAESSTCKGFDIPTNELSKGNWHIVIKVTTGNTSGQAEQDITIS